MSRPNILLITTDQQRFDTIHAAGNRSIFTPHLDYLTHTGIRFSRCYADSPVCMASRATIMTGHHGFNNGLTGNSLAVRPMENHPTLPGLLTDSGYQTRAVGKMHFEPLRANYGFEHMEILPDYHRQMDRLGHRPKNHGVGENEMTPVIATTEAAHTVTQWTVERSIDFIETRDTTRPFFLWTSFSKPHPPFDPPRDHWLLYDNVPMPEPVYGDWSTSPEAVPQGFMRSTYVLNNVHRFSAAQLAAARRAYYACITHIDYSLGLLFARLREMELFDNTWIIFTSDHGEMLGDHWMGAKSSFFEGSAHVPMIVRPPTPAKGAPSSAPNPADTVCDELVCLADILPTCMACAGIEPPACDGLDMVAVAEGHVKRDALIGQCGTDHAVIEKRLKYVFTDHGGDALLFDLENDPHEQRDLIRAGTHEDDVQRLRQQLAEHLRGLGHPAVEGDGLRSVSAPRTAHESRQNAWPGFHSTGVPTDVLH